MEAQPERATRFHIDQHKTDPFAESQYPCQRSRFLERGSTPFASNDNPDAAWRKMNKQAEATGLILGNRGSAAPAAFMQGIGPWI
jgi:hypothetical protein